MNSKILEIRKILKNWGNSEIFSILSILLFIPNSYFSLAIFFWIGAETTSSSLSWAFLFLLHHPEVQTRVQAEIDSVVGEGRNVSLEDKTDLPYTNAVLMESMRMATIVPNALPHSASEDIEYNGYIIPKVPKNRQIRNFLYIYINIQILIKEDWADRKQEESIRVSSTGTLLTTNCPRVGQQLKTVEGNVIISLNINPSHSRRLSKL